MKTFRNKTTGLITVNDFNNVFILSGYWLIFLVLTVLAAICLFPPLWLMLSSMKSMQELYSLTPSLFPEKFEFSKFTETWKMLKFSLYYFNSLKILVGEVFFSIVFNSLLGYALSQLKPKGWKFIFNLLLLTLLVPNTVSLVPVYKNIISFPIFHFNMTNTYWPMWFMAGANAFFVLLFKSFFDEIPVSFTEAAMLDGCSPFRIFTVIMVPLSKPVFFVVTIFTVTRAWSDFFWPYMVLSDKSQYTVMIRLFNMISGANSGKGLSLDMQMLAILFSMIPPMIIFFILQKHIMGGGLTLGGIKG